MLWHFWLQQGVFGARLRQSVFREDPREHMYKRENLGTNGAHGLQSEGINDIFSLKNRC